jgi:hypothetical protein
MPLFCPVLYEEEYIAHVLVVLNMQRRSERESTL